jgi:activating signal cointegrator 1
MPDIRGLSLAQPWATLVAIGAKRIETRSWFTRYRGWVAIHAAKGFPARAQSLCYHEQFAAALGFIAGPRLADGAFGFPLIGSDEAIAIRDGIAALPLGAVVAVARLVGCFRFTQSATYRLPAAGRRTDDGLWLTTSWHDVELTEAELAFGDCAPGRYGWALADVRPLPEPLPCRGALGLWAVPAEVRARLIELTEGGDV